MHTLLHRIYREVAFFTDPREITGPRASGVPLMGFAHTAYNLTVESVKSLGYTITGTERDKRDTGPDYYLPKLFPIAGTATKLLEAHPQHRVVQ